MLKSLAPSNDKYATPNACNCPRNTQTAHLKAPRESASRKAQLARVQQKWKSEARYPSGHEHTQCEGDGAFCRGFCGLEGKRSEDDGFSQPMPTTLEDLGQSVLCQHHRCASGRKRPRTLVHFPETVALQTPRQQPRMEHSEWVSGSKPKIVSTRWVHPTARWEDADQWSSHRKAN